MYRHQLSLVLIGVIILTLLGYGLFEARKILTGPEIYIATPKDGSATSSPVVVISGEATNIAFLSINDAPAYIDTAGHFSEVFSPPPGYSVVKVAAKDRFGRQVSQLVHIVVLNYCPING